MSVKQIVHLLLELFVSINSLWFMRKPNDPVSTISTLHRSNFPENFTFGTASASYQYEGAHHEDGRGPSIWDTYTHKHPERIADGGNGDVAVDHYHRYKEDIALIKDMGLDSYRFSISWPRILPHGKLSGGINKKGIQFYNNIIDELLSKGLEPYVTIFHWDVPQYLEEEYGGFLSSQIVPDFKDYAELCFKEFGDRVKKWVTLNEPWTFSNHGYNLGAYAPGRCSKWVGNCSVGDSGTEPYIVGHNLLLSHSAAVNVYREKYQTYQKGTIGIVLILHWMEPFSQSKADRDAAQRAIDFMFGWFMHPITYGKYPDTMTSLCGNRLPRFTNEESFMLKGSFEFLGFNYYTSKYAENNKIPPDSQVSYLTDSQARLTTERNGVPIGPKAGSDWLAVYPIGIHKALLYIKNMYNNPVIYITENGVDEVNDNLISLEEALKDHRRIDYHLHHLRFVLSAIKNGVDVRGYFIWSLLDNFEWNEGYTVRFGLNYVNFKNMTRYPKHSSIWFKKFIYKEV